MLDYGKSKLREIGARGVMAGWSLSFFKDALGSALFFGTFEYIKSQSFYSFITWYYGSYDTVFSTQTSARQVAYSSEGRLMIRPHYALEPSFILAAGVTASVAQQLVVYPLSNIQTVHYERLEQLDIQAKKTQNTRSMLNVYYHAYEKTLAQCSLESKTAGGWRKYLYRGFLLNTMRQIPSTSAGLIVFELVRRKYATEAEAVRIEKDGYDILLS